MKNAYFLLALILLLSACSSMSPSAPWSFQSGGLRFSKTLTTWKDRLEQHLVMQKFDYSCGAASLATLLRYYFQDPITEQAILTDITQQLTPPELANRHEKGFSLLDLKRFAERRGYQALGVKLKLSALPKLRGPILVYLSVPEGQHFAILRGVKHDFAFLADPSRGNLRMLMPTFVKEWTGIALVLGKKGFGAPTDYPLAIRDEELIKNERRIVRKGLYLGR